MEGVFDAIVVGAGPAGSSAAHRLSELGIGRILVIERLSDTAFSRYHSICGEAVSDRSLKRAGVEPLESIRRVDGIRISFPEGITVEIPVSGHIVDRARMVRRLLDGSGAERIRATVLSVSADGDSYKVSTTAGEFRSGILIGADGAHSVVRRCVFGSSPSMMLPIENCLMDGEGGRMLDFEVGGRDKGFYSWRFPSHDGTVSVGSVRGWCRPEGAVPTGSRHIPIGKVDRVHDGNGCYLVGDAAGLPNPLSYGGIGAALISGRKAAAAGKPRGYTRFIARDRMFEPRFMEAHDAFSGWDDATIRDAISPFRNGYSMARCLLAMLRRPGYALIYFGCWVGFRIGWRFSRLAVFSANHLYIKLLQTAM